MNGKRLLDVHIHWTMIRVAAHQDRPLMGNATSSSPARSTPLAASGLRPGPPFEENVFETIPMSVSVRRREPGLAVYALVKPIAYRRMVNAATRGRDRVVDEVHITYIRVIGSCKRDTFRTVSRSTRAPGDDGGG